MTQTGTVSDVIRYWNEKAEESLEAAKDEFRAGRLSFSVNRIYYACFYAVSAYLVKVQLHFSKHAGVRAAFHKHVVKEGLISRDFGKLYDELFEARQRGDYIELVQFKPDQVEDWLGRARPFLDAMKSLIGTSKAGPS